MRLSHLSRVHSNSYSQVKSVLLRIDLLKEKEKIQREANIEAPPIDYYIHMCTLYLRATIS